MTELSAASAANRITALPLAFMAVVIIFMGFGLYAAFIAGPRMRAVAQRNLGRTLADENRAFCEKFGMHVRTDEFLSCSQELMVIRKNQVERDSEAGML